MSRAQGQRHVSGQLGGAWPHRGSQCRWLCPTQRPRFRGRPVLAAGSAARPSGSQAPALWQSHGIGPRPVQAARVLARLFQGAPRPQARASLCSFIPGVAVHVSCGSHVRKLASKDNVFKANVTYAVCKCNTLAMRKVFLKTYGLPISAPSPPPEQPPPPQNTFPRRSSGAQLRLSSLPGSPGRRCGASAGCGLKRLALRAVSGQSPAQGARFVPRSLAYGVTHSVHTGPLWCLWSYNFKDFSDNYGIHSTYYTSTWSSVPGFIFIGLYFICPASQQMSYHHFPGRETEALEGLRRRKTNTVGFH